MEIEINGIQAELGNSTPALTKKSIDINSPSSRFVDFSNKFQLPDTAVNRRIFDSPEGVGTNNRSFDKLYDVIIRDSNIIFRGKGYLDSSNRNEFSFQIVDNSKELFKALDVKLKDVSWDDKDTILTQAAIDSLDDFSSLTCWFWGKACYHTAGFIGNTDQTTGDSRTKYSRPAFNVTGLLRRAINAAGHTFTLPDFNLAISSNHKQFFFTSYQKTFNATFNPAGTLNLTDLTSYDFKHADVTVSSDEITMLHRTILRFRGHVTTNASIYLNVHAHDAPHSKEIVSQILLPSDGYIDFSTSEIYDTPAGMLAYIQLIGTGQVVFTDMLMYTILDEKNEDLSTNHWLDFKIKAYDNLPDLTYLDLFRTICVIGNRYPIVDNFNKVFSFGSLENLSKMNSVDWSEKFVIGSQQINSDIGGLNQKNWLKYTNDITVPFDLGWYYFSTDGEQLPAEGDYLVMNFGASKEVNIAGSDIAHVSVYSDETRIIDQELSPRLFLIDGTKLVFDPLRWQALASGYYSNWFNCLYRVRAVTADFNLSKLDFMKWHPLQVVYIDYFKSTFVVLEISNFIPGRKTRVKLLNYGR